MVSTNADITIIERLVKFMEFNKLNDNKITSIAKLSIGLIGRARKKNSGLHSDTIGKILLAFPELNPTWLLTGKECMIINGHHKNDNDTEGEAKDSLVDDIFKEQRNIVKLISLKFHRGL